MHKTTVLIAAVALAGCTGVSEPTPTAGVQGTATLDCDAAVKPQGSVGVSVGTGGIRPKASVGLVVDLLQIGKSQDTLQDCAKAGVKTGATAGVGIQVGL